jgi:hypothetical protein
LNESDENDPQFEKQSMAEWIEETAVRPGGGFLIRAVKARGEWNKRKKGAVALGCRNETSRGGRLTQRLDANREGEHRTILEETDPREEGGAASREHVEGRVTRCVEEKWKWVDLHCDMGRKSTFLIGFYANKWEMTQKLFLS